MGSVVSSGVTALIVDSLVSYLRDSAAELDIHLLNVFCLSSLYLIQTPRNLLGVYKNNFHYRKIVLPGQ